MKLRLLLAAWVAAAILMYWMMSHGPGISPDSIVYLESARSILAGQGLVVAGLPMTHFPPVYPLLLAAIGLVDHDLQHAARLLQAFLFGANVVLAGSAVYLGTGRRIGPAACAVLLFVVSPEVLDLHAMAWSEPLFLAFTLSGLLVLAAHVVHPNRRMLALGAICFGLAMATRYVGIMLIAVLLWAIWVMGSRPVRARIRDTLFALPLAVGPLGLWMVRNAVVSNGVTDRHLVWHPVGRDALRQFVLTSSNLIYPVPGRAAVKLVALLLLLGAVAMMWRRPAGEEHGEWGSGFSRSLRSVCTFFVAAYVVFLLVSVSVADAATPLDDRLLFPAFGCAIVAVTIIGDRFARSRPRARWVLSGLVVLSLGLRIGPAAITVIRVHRDGSGYNSEGWRESPAIAQLGLLPPGTVVFSNASRAVGYLTALRSLRLPDSLAPETLLPNPRFPVEISTLCERVNSGHAVAVYLTTEGIGEPDEQADLEKRCVFQRATRYPDGTIYGSVLLPAGPAS